MRCDPAEHPEEHSHDRLSAILFDNPVANAADWTQERPVWRPSQIAQHLGVEARTVQLWCEHGMLRATKTAGGHYRVSSEALRKFLDGPEGAQAARAA